MVDDRRSRVSGAEIMLTAVVAALYHASNHVLAKRFLCEHGYVKVALSHSRFSRRVHQIPEAAWQMTFALLGHIFQQHNTSGDYAVDSMPVLVCQNVRINRCHLFPAQQHPTLRGYQASKKRYFYGFKVHLVVTAQGEPVEFFLSPGNMHDLEGLRHLCLDLPPGSTLYADKAYQSQAEAEFLQQNAQVRLIALRRANSKNPLPPELLFLCQTIRQSVETAFGHITRISPHTFHATSPQGFLLKLNIALIAFAFHKLYN
jgi:hypothetical protein